MIRANVDINFVSTLAYKYLLHCQKKEKKKNEITNTQINTK